MFDPDELRPEPDPRQEMIDLIAQEMSDTRRHMSEVRDQIDQMQSAVDKEQNRYSSIAIDLRNLKDTLETQPREDIRSTYEEALEVRFRMATMRGQLEKFETNYQYMQEQLEIYSRILSKLQGYDELPEIEPEARSPGVLDIAGIIRAQEEERQRLARQMHDGPAQSLTNFILQAEICQRLFDRNPDRAAEELDNLKTNASRTFQKVRDFIFDLRPMMLDDLGVVPTVRRYVESFREKNDIETHIEIFNEDRRLENYREVIIFRSVQELMAMARDYAAPNEVSIRLDMSGSPISIVVSDDGRGFDAKAISASNSSSDARVQSLRTLKSKFELIGGTISVTSDEDSGTIVRLELPLEA